MSLLIPRFQKQFEQWVMKRAKIVVVWAWTASTISCCRQWNLSLMASSLYWTQNLSCSDLFYCLLNTARLVFGQETSKEDRNSDIAVPYLSALLINLPISICSSEEPLVSLFEILRVYMNSSISRLLIWILGITLSYINMHVAIRVMGFRPSAVWFWAILF